VIVRQRGGVLLREAELVDGLLETAGGGVGLPQTPPAERLSTCPAGVLIEIDSPLEVRDRLIEQPLRAASQTQKL